MLVLTWPGVGFPFKQAREVKVHTGTQPKRFQKPQIQNENHNEIQ